MRWIWCTLKFAGRWLGPVLLVLAALIFLLLPMPFQDLERLPLLAGIVISAIAWVFTRAPRRRTARRVLALGVLLGLAFYGWRIWDEKRGYHEESVSFDNRGAHLVGTLFLPDRPGRSPGVVMLGGSPGISRNAYRGYAAHFAQTGYVVLLYDKRGVGASSGERQSLMGVAKDLDLLADDASAALTLLAARPEVRSEAVGFVGVSEGGFIAPRAAVLNGHARFVVSITGPTMTLYEIARFQSGSDKIITEFRSAHIADFDPMPSLRVLNVPGLWVLAEKDQHSSNATTIRDLETLKRLGKPYDYRVIPGAWHALLVGPKKLIFETIDQWLAQVTAASRPRAVEPSPA